MNTTSPARRYASAGLPAVALCLSVRLCLCVCVCVCLTSRSSIETAEQIEVVFVTGASFLLSIVRKLGYL